MLKTKEERQSDLHPQETSEWLEALDQVMDEAVRTASTIYWKSCWTERRKRV